MKGLLIRGQVQALVLRFTVLAEQLPDIWPYSYDNPQVEEYR